MQISYAMKKLINWMKHEISIAVVSHVDEGGKLSVAIYDSDFDFKFNAEN